MVKKRVIVKILVFVCPLPVVLMSLGNLFTEEQFRTPWSDISLWSGPPFAALLITVLLISARRRKYRACGLFALLPASLVWIASCVLGAFSLMASVYPGWFG